MKLRQIRKRVIAFCLSLIMITQCLAPTIVSAMADNPAVSTEQEISVEPEEPEKEQMTSEESTETPGTAEESTEQAEATEDQEEAVTTIEDSSEHEEENETSIPGVEEGVDNSLQKVNEGADKGIRLSSYFTDLSGNPLLGSERNNTILKTGEKVYANFTLQPDGWGASGIAYDVDIYIYLPYINAEGFMTDSAQMVTPQGVKGTFIDTEGEGGSWSYTGVETPNSQNGGWMRIHRASLVGNSSPGFMVELEFFGKVAEGATGQIFAYATYSSFEETGEGWTTPGSKDEDSVLSLTNSNLEWEIEMNDISSPIIPWERYNYGDYEYIVRNTTDESATSTIDGYNLFFSVPSYELYQLAGGGGIIEEDAIRWIYQGKEDEPVLNPDLQNYSDKKFIGIPEKGGILIYDLSDWNEDEPYPDPLPYIYSGNGRFTIEVPDDIIERGTERNYLIRVPYISEFDLEVQEYPFTNDTTIFFGPGKEGVPKKQLTKVTNGKTIFESIKMGGEIKKTADTNPASYGGIGYYTINGIKNTSNVDAFQMYIVDHLPNASATRQIKVMMPEAAGAAALWKWLKQDHPYQFEVMNVLNVLDKKWVDFAPRYVTEKGLQNGYYVWEIDFKSFYQENTFTPMMLTGDIRFNFVNRIKTKAEFPGKIEIHGFIDTMDTIRNTADLYYSEKKITVDVNDYEGRQYHYLPQPPVRATADMQVAVPQPKLTAYSFLKPNGGTEIKSASDIEVGYKEMVAGYEYIIGNASKSVMPNAYLEVTLPVNDSKTSIVDRRNKGFQTKEVVFSKELLAHSELKEMRFYDIDDNDMAHPFIIDKEAFNAIPVDENGNRVITREIWSPDTNAADSVLHLGKVNVLFETLDKELSDVKANLRFNGYGDDYNTLISKASLRMYETDMIMAVNASAKLTVVVPELKLTAYSFFRPTGGNEIKNASNTQAGYEVEVAGYEYVIGNASKSMMPNAYLEVTLPVKGSNTSITDQRLTGFQTQEIVLFKELIAHSKIKEIRLYDVDDTSMMQPFIIDRDAFAAILADDSGNKTITKRMWCPDENAPNAILHVSKAIFLFETLDKELTDTKAALRFNGYGDDYGTLNSRAQLGMSGSTIVTPASANTNLVIAAANPLINSESKFFTHRNDGSVMDTSLWDKDAKYTNAGYARPGTYIHQVGNTAMSASDKGVITITMDTDDSGNGFAAQVFTFNKDMLGAIDMNFIQISDAYGNAMRLVPKAGQYEVQIPSGSGAADEFIATGLMIMTQTDGNLVITHDDFSTLVPFPSKIEVDLNYMLPKIEYSDATAILLDGFITKEPGQKASSTAVFSTEKKGYPNIINKDRADFAVAKGPTLLRLEAEHRVDESTPGAEYTEIVPSTHYYNGDKYDYNLEVGYKALASYWLGYEKATGYLHNINTTFETEIQVPADYFDLYYLKLDPAIKPYITGIDIYRKGSNVPWQSLSPEQWVDNANNRGGNSDKDFWRINVAHEANSGSELFRTVPSSSTSVAATLAEASHPYYKKPFDTNQPPVSPVTLIKIRMEFDQGEMSMDASEFGGIHSRMIELSGRFYKVGSNIKPTTQLTEVRGFGAWQKKYTATTHTRYADTAYVDVLQPDALVYKGAIDATSNDTDYIVPMGTEQRYVIGYVNAINYGSASVNWGQRWRGTRASFQDNMMMRDILPPSPLVDANYNFDPTKIVVGADTAKYLHTIKLTISGEEESRVIDVAALSNNGFTIPISHNNTEAIDQDAIVLKNGQYLTQVEFYMKEIPGSGDRTAELEGMGPDFHGPYSSNTTIDISVYGIVNGTKRLDNKVELWRQMDEETTPVHYNSRGDVGYLQGQPLTIAGQVINTNLEPNPFTYDYKQDLYTPNTTSWSVNLKNTGAAPLKQFDLTTHIYNYMSLEKIVIPSEIFDGPDWQVSNVQLYVRDGTSDAYRAYYMPDSWANSYDFAPLFTHNVQTDVHELDIESLFQNDILKSTGYPVKIPVSSPVTYSGELEEFNREGIYYVKMTIIAKDPSSTVLNAGEMLFETNEKGIQFTGRWVDKNKNMSAWNDSWDASRPTNPVRNTYSTSNDQVHHVNNATYHVSNTTSATFHSAILFSQSPTTAHSSNLNHQVYNRYSVISGEIYSERSDDSSERVFLDDTSQPNPLTIKYNELMPGDYSEFIIKLKNDGEAPGGDNTAGNFPVINPQIYLELPTGMGLVKWELVTAGEADMQNSIAQNNICMSSRATSAIITPESNYTGTEKNFVFDVNGTVDYGKAIYIKFYVEIINDFNPEDLYAWQGKSMQFNIYMRPGYLHGYDPHTFKSGHYNLNNYLSRNVWMNTNTLNFDGISHITDFHRAYPRNNYLYMLNATAPGINARFTGENITGFDAEIVLGGSGTAAIQSEAHHDETQLELIVDLDSHVNNLQGFILSEWPEPAYPAGWSNYSFEYPAPKLYYSLDRTDGADSWFLVEPDTVVDFALVKQLKIDYGKLPAYKDGDFSGDNPVMPDVLLKGNAYWQDTGAPNANYADTYIWGVKLTKILSHYHENGTINAKFKNSSADTQIVAKGTPKLELKLDVFSNKTDAQSGSNIRSTYRPNDELWQRIDLKNHKIVSNGNSGLAPGSVPLLDPVIYDKVPEYLILPASMGTSGTIDISQVIANGDMEIRWYQADGTQRSGSDFTLPTVTAYERTDFDIGGAQQYAEHAAGHYRANSSSSPQGLFGDYQPNNLVQNPAAKIKFTVFKYQFAEPLERGERIEIIYKTAARQENLPLASYASGGDVYSPYMNMYGVGTPVATNTSDMPMDMNSLRHEAGASGTPNSQLEWGDFLSESYAHVPGNGNIGSPSSPYNGNVYDTDMQTGSAHTIRLIKTAAAPSVSYNMYTGNTNYIDDVWTYIMKSRLSSEMDWENVGAIPLQDRPRILWAQNSLHLERAWLYSASQMIPVNQNQFYEADQNTRRSYDYNTAATVDNYTYALEYNETFTTRLKAVNYGDGDLEKGVQMIEVLPKGVAPVLDNSGNPVVSVYYGDNTVIDDAVVEVIQKPGADAGFKAPSSLMEGSQTSRTYYDDTVPWVVKITVNAKLGKWWNRGSGSQHIICADLTTKVISENLDEAWYDQLYIMPLRDLVGNSDLYYTTYDKTYGNYNLIGSGNYLAMDAVMEGMDASYASIPYFNGYPRYEPYGSYIRGENVQCLAVKESDLGIDLNGDGNVDDLPVVTTGDKALVRKPMVRTWSVFGNNSIAQMHQEPYQSFDLNINVQNRYLWSEPAYSSWHSSARDDNAEEYRHNHQTDGGAYGTLFEPVITNILPEGIVPVNGVGECWPASGPTGAQASWELDWQLSGLVGFSKEDFDVAIRYLKQDANGKPLNRYVLQFTPKDFAPDRRVNIADNQALKITAKVYAADVPDSSYLDEDGVVKRNEAYQAEWQKNFTYISSKRDINFFKTENDVGSPYIVGNVRQNRGASIASNTSTAIWNADAARQDSTGENGNLPLGGIYKPIDTVRHYQETDQNASMQLESWITGVMARNPLYLDDESKKNLNGNGTFGINDGSGELQYVDHGVYNTTRLFVKKPNIYAVKNIRKTDNTTGLPTSQVETVVDNYAYGDRLWYGLTVQNRKNDSYTGTYIERQQQADSGTVLHAQFILTDYLPEYIRYNGSFCIETDDVNNPGTKRIITSDELALLGWKVELLQDYTQPSYTGDRPHTVQFMVTIPKDAFDADGTLEGSLPSGKSFTLIVEGQINKTPSHESVGDPVLNWRGDQYRNAVYVSLRNTDGSFIEEGAGHPLAQQPVEQIQMYQSRFDDESENLDYDLDGEYNTKYAYADTNMELTKPNGTIRKETQRQRVALPNGNVMDASYAGSEPITYLLDEIHNDGAPVPEFIIEDTLPYPENTGGIAAGSGSIAAERDWISIMRSVSTGVWEMPSGYELDNYKIYVYYSHKGAVPDWKPLNPGGSPLDENRELTIPISESELMENPIHKIRWVIKSDDSLVIPVPKGLRLAVDADDTIPGNQEKSQTDPQKLNQEQHSQSVLDNSIRVTLSAISNIHRLYPITNHVELYTRYSEHDTARVDEDSTRVYITEIKPTVDLKIGTKYFAPTGSGVNRWGDNLVINPINGVHLKYDITLLNAERNMWTDEYKNNFNEDPLIDPVVVTALSPLVSVDSANFRMVSYDDLDESSPLSENYERNRDFSAADAGVWTWHLVSKDSNNTTSNVVFKGVETVNPYVGSWMGMDRNILRFRFEGILDPGDKIVIEYIASVKETLPTGSTSDYQMMSEAMVLNNTGLLTGLFMPEILDDHLLALGIDTYDLDDDSSRTDLLVTTTSVAFGFASFDDFPKKKTAYSELNLAGTSAPALTAVAEGRRYSFQASIQNTNRENGRKFPYPVIFDILPYPDDQAVVGSKTSDAQHYTMTERGSKWQGYLIPESVQLLLRNAVLKDEPVNPAAYEVWVGPIQRVAGEAIAGDTSLLPDGDTRSPIAYYEQMAAQNSTLLSDSFMRISELNAMKATKPEQYEKILRNITAVWVQFTDKSFQMEGNSKYTLKYEMRAPLNLPYYSGSAMDTSGLAPYAAWNSFAAWRRDDVAAGESNAAGVYLMERPGRVHIGDYVWWDANQNGLQDEAVDAGPNSNGRDIKEEFVDLDGDGVPDDPGINGVTVELLTPDGFASDKDGNRVKQQGDAWYVVNENGAIQTDELGTELIGGEPVSYITEADYEWRNGYYILSDLMPGNYRLRYTFPECYKDYGITTPTVHNGTKLKMYAPGDELPDGSTASTLIVITDPFILESGKNDSYYVDFDLGIDRGMTFGGVVWQDEESPNPDHDLNGLIDAGEQKLPGYVVTLRQMDGTIVTNMCGDQMQTVSDADGKYQFDHIWKNQQYYVTLDVNDQQTMKPSPVMHSTQPLFKQGDNDLYLDKSTGELRTHTFITAAELMSDNPHRYAPVLNIDLGLCSNAKAIIGNFVWDDQNRNGLQDDGEPGISGQTVKLKRYILVGSEWREDDSFNELSTVSGEGGFYYFKNLQVGKREYLNNSWVESVYGYQVYLDELPDGYCITKPKVTDGAPLGVNPDLIDSDVQPDGKLNQVPVILAEPSSNLLDHPSGYDLSSAVSNLDLDIGLVPFDKGTLGGTIWNDLEADHLLGGGDERLSNYKLYLEVEIGGAYRPVYINSLTGAAVIINSPGIPGGHVQYQTQSNGEGYYEFTGLPIADPVTRVPYQYRVIIEKPIEWSQLVNDHAGGTVNQMINSKFVPDLLDENIAISDSYTLVRNEAAGALDPYDFFNADNVAYNHCGLHQYRTHTIIGDWVWNDLNANGIQDPGEPGVKDVKVTLYRFEPASWSDPEGAGRWIETVDQEGKSERLTDADGFYEFCVPVAGMDENAADYKILYRYRIGIERPVDAVFSPVAAEGAEEAKNSDFVSLPPLEEGQEGRNFNTTEFKGITRSETTGISREIILADAKLSYPQQADFKTSRDDLDVDCGLQVPITPGSSTGIGSGFELRTIGDYIWHDQNGNGLQESNEPGLAGYQVSLYRYIPNDVRDPQGTAGIHAGHWEKTADQNGNDTVFTNQQGWYEFLVPVAGFDETADDYQMPYEYRVVFTKRDSDEFSPHYTKKEETGIISSAIPVLGTDGKPDRDKRLERLEGIPTGKNIAVTPVIQLAQWDVLTDSRHQVKWETAIDNLNMDCGIRQLTDVRAKIGDLVWNDANDNGQQDKGEACVKGMKVSLYRFKPQDPNKPDGAGHWIPTKDVNGIGQIVTSDDGKYVFEVSAACGDPMAKEYRIPYRYRFVYEKTAEQRFSTRHKAAGVPEEKDNDLMLTTDSSGKARSIMKTMPGIPIGVNLGVSTEIQLCPLIQMKDGTYQADLSAVCDQLNVDAAILDPDESTAELKPAPEPPIKRLPQEPAYRLDKNGQPMKTGDSTIAAELVIAGFLAAAVIGVSGVWYRNSKKKKGR